MTKSTKEFNVAEEVEPIKVEVEADETTPEFTVKPECSAAVHVAVVELLNAGLLSLTHPLVVALVAACKG
jgi:hypothetical protein